MSRARAARPPRSTPRSLLLPYQLRWVCDRSRFKIGMWGRQTGKDFSCAAEAVEDCLQTPKTQWTILAAGERQALESVYQAKLWAEAYAFAIDQIREDRSGGEALIRSAEIWFANGSRLRALPANPATCRGLSTNLILTEFAFHERPDDIWRAIYPSISNPLRGGEKRLRIISTPNGRGNKFAELWFGAQAPGSLYAASRVTIHDAVAQGLPLDVDELRAGLNDPEGWAQEYECEFIDSSAVLLPYELIAQVESPECLDTASPEFWSTPAGASDSEIIHLGLDFGRKKDLTVCWALGATGSGCLATREVLCLAKMSTPRQVEVLAPRVQRAHRVALDYTGPGVGLGDYLVEKFGQYDPERHQFGKVQLVTFTQSVKCELFSKLRIACESRRLGIPVSRAIREDLHSIQRVALAGGGVTYRAPHTPDGHADRCTALALAVHAASAAGLCGTFRAFRDGKSHARRARQERTVTA